MAVIPAENRNTTDIEVEDDFIILRDEYGHIASIQSINSYPIDYDVINALNMALKQNCNSIKSLKLHLCVDRGYVYDENILNKVRVSCETLFNSFISCHNLEVFEFYILQLPHQAIKYYFDTIIMNENVVFKKLYWLSIDVNEHLLIFLAEYCNESKYKQLNLYQPFLLRHKFYLTQISIQVHLSPNHIMLSIANQLTNLQQILAILIWRLLGSIYLSEIELKSFYFWCRYNVNVHKLIPLLQHMIVGNCSKTLATFSLNLSHLQSAHIATLLKCMTTHCDKYALKSFTLNSLDTVSHRTVKHSYRFLTFSNAANKCLNAFLFYFINLEDISLNMAQFQLYQYNELLKTITNLSNINQLYLGDSCIPNLNDFGFYDEINIWQNFSKLIENASDMNIITVNIEKMQVVAQFLMKNNVLIDSIYNLYFSLQKRIISIYTELEINNYPKEIISLIIGYTYNCNQDFIVSFQGSHKLLDSKSKINQYVKQFYNEKISESRSCLNVPHKHIRMVINGTVVVNTQKPVIL